MSQSAHIPPKYVTTTTTSTKAPEGVEWSIVSDPTNWNVVSLPFSSGEIITAEKLNRAFFRVTSQDHEASLAPPKNFLQRMLWRALGVTWKDLRPERKMEELGKLK